MAKDKLDSLTKRFCQRSKTREITDGFDEPSIPISDKKLQELLDEAEQELKRGPKKFQRRIRKD